MRTDRWGKAHRGEALIVLVVVGDRSKVEAPLRALELGKVDVLTVEDVMGPAPKTE